MNETLKRAAELLRQDCLREVGSDEVSQVATKLEALAAQMGEQEQEAQPLFILHTGAFFGNEQDEWEVEAISQERVDDYCRERSSQHDPLYAVPPDAAKRISKLEAQLAEARKDAERYRWLRHGDNDEVVMQRGMTHPWLPRNEKLDAIIDAAIAKEKSND